MDNEQLITLEWKSEQHGAVKTAFYRPANLTVVVKSAKASESELATWWIFQNNALYNKGWERVMQDCQLTVIRYLETRAAHSLWDSEWLASKITPYLQANPLALLEYGWQEKLGAYCNSPAEVVVRHPAIEAHKQWLKEEWARLGYIEARALNALTFSFLDTEEKDTILHILGRNG